MKYGSVAFCSLAAPLLALLMARLPQVAGGDPPRASATVLASFVDRDGKPVYGVRIEGEAGPGAKAVAKVDPDGRLEVVLQWNGRFQENWYIGEARRRGFGVHHFEVDVQAGQVVDLGRIVLKPGGVLRGRVAREGGGSIGPVGLQVVPADEHGARPQCDDQDGPNERAAIDWVASNDDGSFEIVGVPIGSWSVAAKHESTYWTMCDVFRMDAGATIEVPVVTLRALPDTFRIEGVVLSPDGQPESGVEVTTKVSARIGLTNIVTTATTDASGQFRLYLARLPDGAVDVSVLPQNLELADAFAAGVQPGARDVIFRLVPARHLRMRVADDRGQAVENYGWNMGPLVRAASGWTVDSEAFHENGLATVRGPTEPFSIRISSSAHWPHKRLFFESGALPEIVEIELTARARY